MSSLVSDLKRKVAELEQELGQKQSRSDPDDGWRIQLDDLVDKLQVGAYQSSIDVEGTLLHANKALAKLLGFETVDQLKEIRFHQVFFEPDEYRHFVEDAVRHMSLRNRELRVRRRDGAERWVNAAARVRYDPGERTIRLEGIFEDITARKHAEEKIQSLNADLEERVKVRTTRLEAALDELKSSQDQVLQMQKLEAIGALAAGMAHEINTPIQFVGDNLRFLADVMGDYLSLVTVYRRLSNDMASPRERALARAEAMRLEEEFDLDSSKDDVQAAIDDANEGIDRVSEIVTAMKDFARPGGAIAPTDLGAAIRNTLIVSKREYEQVADVTLHLAENLPEISCDEASLKQALFNVIVNAAQAIEDRQREAADESPQARTQGCIAISVAIEGEMAAIRIADDGVGMSEGTRCRVFEPFFTTREVGSGSGQGLSVVHRIVVKQHGGRVEIESCPGQGTTASIFLPLGGS